LAARGDLIQANGFKTLRSEASSAAGERVLFYEIDRKIGVATSEFWTFKQVSLARL
jgi:hypothetical protein